EIDAGDAETRYRTDCAHGELLHGFGEQVGDVDALHLLLHQDAVTAFAGGAGPCPCRFEPGLGGHGDGDTASSAPPRRLDEGGGTEAADEGPGLLELARSEVGPAGDRDTRRRQEPPRQVLRAADEHCLVADKGGDHAPDPTDRVPAPVEVVAVGDLDDLEAAGPGGSDDVVAVAGGVRERVERTCREVLGHEPRNERVRPDVRRRWFTVTWSQRPPASCGGRGSGRRRLRCRRPPLRATTVPVTLADWSARAVQRVGRCVLQLPALSACGDDAEPDEGEGGVMEGHRGARGWSQLG